ncbi:MAG: AbrB/MazE/SpoVT family DNA-binding domain-containing protein [Pseudomonadota bacterium]|nr:AbrB/MazE/SpoVT family DNA-binding domain-containing protein [Pseudomonadota bacterium]
MPIVTSRTFRSGNSQAVRLPKEVAFPDDTAVTMVRSGEVLTIYPTKPPISEMIDKLLSLPGPGAIEIRDTEEIPERAGL